MNLIIKKYPNPILNQKCEQITNFETVTFRAELMFQTMTQNGGIGLASSQVGSLFRMFVSSVLPNRIICNPSWRPTPSSFDYMVVESCLSFPGWIVPVKRYDAIFAEYQDENGTKIKKILKGLAAQVFQHETDHLDGITIIEHLNNAQQNTINTYYKKKEGV